MTATDKTEDKELKEYLAGDSDVSHAYRQLTNEEPSTTVDAAIRAAARREAKSGRRFITNPFGQQWTVPTSLAAMLLISIGLVVFMSDETGTDRFGPGVLEEITQHKLDSSAGRTESFADDKAPTSAKPAADRRSEKKGSGKMTGASAADAAVTRVFSAGSGVSVRIVIQSVPAPLLASVKFPVNTALASRTNSSPRFSESIFVCRLSPVLAVTVAPVTAGIVVSTTDVGRSGMTVLKRGSGPETGSLPLIITPPVLRVI